jgi:hypothetical protein
MTTAHAADDTAAMAKVLADFLAAVSFPEGLGLTTLQYADCSAKAPS